MKLKKKVPMLIIMALFIAITGMAMAATTSVRVFVDGSEVQFPDQKPIINSDNRTLVPVRFVSEALGAEVEWLAPTRTVKINYNDKLILLEVGLKQAVIGTSVVTLDTKTEIVGNRTMVPLRFVSECLGAEVEWQAVEQAVYITTANSDQALVDSDLILKTPPPGDNENHVNLIALVYYKYSTPVEPQITDLQELLEKRFTTEQVKPIIDYIKTKQVGESAHIPVKDWSIDGKLIRVSDSILAITVTIWNQGE